MNWQFERSTYRLAYPPSARGKLLTADREVALVDCSERGIRYLADPNDVPELGTRVTGFVRLLSSRQQFPIEGTVVRCVADEVALSLDAPGLPVQAIFAEQRHLVQRFPARFAPSQGR